MTAPDPERAVAEARQEIRIGLAVGKTTTYAKHEAMILRLLHTFEAAVRASEHARLRAALAQAERERDIYKTALGDVHDYARTSYAEGAMRGEKHDGFRDFQHIVNVARRAFRAAAAPPPEEEASRE